MRVSRKKPALALAFVMLAAGGATVSVLISSNGPSKPSRMRSNLTPIWNASV